MDTHGDEISIEAWVRARNVEIAALAEECKVKLPQQMSQRLPRYMRRRAASGNPKRIPKSVRPWWLDEKPSAKKKKQKPKRVPAALAIRSRKRRNEDPSRSPIHVWLAKRFKIQLMWGQRVAWSNNTKNQRSLFRKCKTSYCIYYLSNFMRCVRSNETQSNTYTSPITFEFEGEAFMFVHACERQNITPGQEDASGLFQLVRLVGPKAPQVAESLPKDKCILQTGQMDEKRPFVDVICVQGSFKQHIWPLLSKNKGHLVGGLRDWRMLHLNCNRPCFPFFGFANSIHSPYYERFGAGKRVVTEGTITSSEVTSDLLLSVVLTAAARGTPSEGDDLICPDTGCLIGHVEYGGYCMEAGRGKGVGGLFLDKVSDPRVRVTQAVATLKVEFRSTRTGNRYPGEVAGFCGPPARRDQ